MKLVEGKSEKNYMDGARPKTIQSERGGFAIALLGPRRQCGVWECLVMSM